MPRNHCIFYWTNLHYDGRVYMIVSALAKALETDAVYIYEYPDRHKDYPELPRNVHIIRPRLLFGGLTKKPFKILKTIEYAVRSLLFLLAKKPATIQVHHEIVMYAPIVYKKLVPRTLLVYDDKELYHVRDRNIGKPEFKAEYCLISQSDLIITANEFRDKAVRYMHKGAVKESLVLHNVVFQTTGNATNTSLTVDKPVLAESLRQKLTALKADNKRLLLHQGLVSKQRGEEMIIGLAHMLPADWLLVFIGIPDADFSRVQQRVNPEKRQTLVNLGYVNYKELDDFYGYVDACAIFYLAGTFNNRFCAPNRLYAALNSGKPILVNADNFVLSHAASSSEAGVAIHNPGDAVQFFSRYQVYADKAILLKHTFEMKEFEALKEYYREVSKKFISLES